MGRTVVRGRFSKQGNYQYGTSDRYGWEPPLGFRHERESDVCELL